MKDHERKCWECGNVAVHTSDIAPGVNCKICGSQDTRRKRESMKYRAKIYIDFGHAQTGVTTKECDSGPRANWDLDSAMALIEQATGGHIEQYVDGIGWVVCEENGQ